MKATAITILAVALAATAARAENLTGLRISTSCQMNKGEGRILVSDGHVLPKNWMFKVVEYRPTSDDGFWTSGPCVLRLTHMLPVKDRLDY